MSDDQTQAILAGLRSLQKELTEFKTDTREDLGEIKTHTSETNGRVRKLELWQARVQGATSVFSWVQPAVAAVVGGVIVAVVLAVLGVP